MIKICEKDIYYAMACAYDDNNNQKKCVEAVREKFSEYDEYKLEELWYAIDAYVDMNL